MFGFSFVQSMHYFSKKKVVFSFFFYAVFNSVQVSFLLFFFFCLFSLSCRPFFINKLHFLIDGSVESQYITTLTKLQNSIFKSTNSAPCLDEILYTLLKEFPIIPLKYLLDIYNIWISGNIPTIWKQAITIPILKKQKYPTNPTSFRPIALTSCPSKTLEKMINLRLTWFLESKNLLSNIQTGFRSKRNTIDQIVRIETLIREAFINKDHLVAVLFDLEKAFLNN